MPTIRAWVERWPIAGAFTTAHGSKTEAQVVVADIVDGDWRGRGEATPYPRYGETPSGVLADIERVSVKLEAGAAREALQALLPAGAARNALDCALWDLEAKRTGDPAFRQAGVKQMHPVKTAYTIGLDSPAAMAARARAESRRPMLKVKIGGPRDLEGVIAVRQAAPKTRLIVDANESLTLDELIHLSPRFAELGVKLIEQPLKAGEDSVLEGFAGPVPLCADESLHTRSELDACTGRYACINIKLDKTGGLTEALALAAAARALGLQIMIGSMVATSLAMAPALILAQGADYVDLDGPLLLEHDREPGLSIIGSMIEPPRPELWG